MANRSVDFDIRANDLASSRLSRVGHTVNDVRAATTRYETEVRDLDFALRANLITTDQHTRALDTERRKLDQVTQAQKRLTKETTAANRARQTQARSLGGGLGGLVAGAASRIAGPLAATFGAAALTGRLRDNFTELDELAKRADKLGTVPAELQKLQYASKLSGVEVETLEKAMQSYVQKSAAAERGTKTAAATFAKLGVNVAQLKKLGLPAEMRLIANGLAGIADGEERLNVAIELFGARGSDMVNVLSQGSAALDELFREREAMGGLYSRKQLAGVEAANDAMERSATALAGAMNQAAIDLAPVVEDLANSLTTWLKNSRGDRTEQQARTAKFKGSSTFGEDIPFANAGANLGLAVERWGWDSFRANASGARSSKPSAEKLAQWRELSGGMEAAMDGLQSRSDAASAPLRGQQSINRITASLADDATKRMLAESGKAATELAARFDHLKRAMPLTTREAIADVASGAVRDPGSLLGLLPGLAASAGGAIAVPDALRRRAKEDEKVAAERRGGIPDSLQAVVSRTLTRGNGNLDPAAQTQKNTADLLKEARTANAEAKKQIRISERLAEALERLALPTVAGPT